MSLNPPANPTVFPNRRQAMAALERAAERARLIAEQTGTKLIVIQPPAQTQGEKPGVSKSAA
jgi:hypothetical protein